jgi:hypothetical protein
MRKLMTALTATILITSFTAWKAEATTIPGIGSLPPITGAYSSLERVDCFLSPCSRPPDDYNLGPNRAEEYSYYRRYGWNRGYPPPPPYGYNGYGYRPYAYGSGRR